MKLFTIEVTNPSFSDAKTAEISLSPHSVVLERDGIEGIIHVIGGGVYTSLVPYQDQVEMLQACFKKDRPKPEDLLTPYQKQHQLAPIPMISGNFCSGACDYYDIGTEESFCRLYAVELEETQRCARCIRDERKNWIVG